MGYFCFICKSVTDATTISTLVHHFHFRHGITAMQKCRVSCGQQECSRTFDGIHAFRMHLKRHHPTDPHTGCSLRNGAESDHCDSVNMDVLDVDVDELCEVESDNAEQLSINDIHDMFADFIIVLKSKNVAQSIVTFVTQGFMSLFAAATQFCDCGEPTTADNALVCVQRLHDVQDLFESGLKMSEYQIKRHLSHSKGLVEPTSISLGNRAKSVATVTGGVINSAIKFVPESMQYISVIQTLQKLLCDTDNLNVFSNVELPRLSVDPVN